MLEVSALVEQSKQFSTLALEQYYLAMMNRCDTIDVLKKSKMPVLFIMGTEDIAAPLQDVLQQCHLPQVSYIHILENVGHMGMIESAENVNTFIKQFLSSVISFK